MSPPTSTSPADSPVSPDSLPPTDPPARRRRGPAALRHRGFRQLTGAWVFTNIADSALFLMLAAWVKDLTGSDSAAAFVFAALGLPAFIAPFLGQLADRVSRKWLLVASNATMVPIILSAGFVQHASGIWFIYVVTFCYGAMSFLAGAAQSGLVRDLLTDDELAGGNGLLSTIDQVFRLISPLVGTALYMAAGPRAILALTAGCFAVTALLLTRLEVTETPPERSHDSYWADLAGGLHHLRRTAPLGALTIMLAIGVGATGLANVAVFPLMEQGLGVAPAMLGVLVSLQGVGSVIGGISAAAVIRRLHEPMTIAGGLLLMGIGMVPFVVAGAVELPSGLALAFAIVGWALVGLAVPWTVVAFITLRQRLTPPRLQGRVSATTNIALNLPQTLTVLVGAAIIGVLDYRLLIVATIVGLLLAGGGALRTRRHAVTAGPATTAGPVAAESDC